MKGIAVGRNEMSVILAVDDDPIYLQLLADYLGSAQLELLTAEDAPAALEILKQRSVDAIILDGMLPHVPGLDFLRQLKGDARFAQIPVIFQSASNSLAATRAARSSGAAYCLPKPVEPLLFRAIVEGVLREAAERAIASRNPQATSPLLELMCEGCFQFRTLDDARRLALELARICPSPERVNIGLVELFVNAIEHGNLEISYEEKSRLCRLEGWQTEVERRLGLPVYASRRGRVHVTRSRDQVRFVVRDEGPGFRWNEYLDFDPARTFDPNGRGIALARAFAFSALAYQAPGNVVIADVALEQIDVAR